MAAKLGGLKCAWCGRTLPLTRKSRPQQHGKPTCPGSGQQKPTHDRLREAAKENRK